MKTLLKIVLGLAVLVVLLVSVAALSIPLWLGPVVTNGLNTIVPELAGTDFKVECIALNPYAGTFRLREMHLANPSGYAAKEAVGVNTVAVDVAVGNLFDGELRFRNIEINGVYVSYQDDRQGSNNFARIAANVQQKLASASGDKDSSSAAKAEDMTAKDTGEKLRVVIERLHVEGVRVQIGNMPMVLPIVPITLTGLGEKSQEGLTWDELQKAVMESVGKSMNALGGGAKMLGNLGLDATKGVDAALNKVADGKVAGAVGKVTDKIGNGKVLGAVGDGVKKTTGVLGDGVKKTTDVIGDGAKRTTERLGEGAKKLGGILGL